MHPHAKLFLLLSATFALSSCEKELGELTEHEEPRLYVNALITASADSQLLYIGKTGTLHTQHVPGARVGLSCNGTPCFEGMMPDANSLLITKTDFRPGDRIAIDVQHGALHAQASADVPAPVIITGIDTMTVMAKRHKSSQTYDQHTRYLVHLRLPDDTRAADELLYFRAEIYKDIYVVSSYSIEGDRVSEVHLKTYDDHTQFGYWGDPALTESENADQENLSVSFDWLNGIENIYHVFRSNYFVHGEYTLRLDLPEPYFYDRRTGMAQDVRIRIYAISRTEYNYLQALSALKTLDTGTLYDSEPGVTSNVVGGAGIFCIESMTEASFYENRQLLKVGSTTP